VRPIRSTRWPALEGSADLNRRCSALLEALAGVPELQDYEAPLSLSIPLPKIGQGSQER